MRALLIALIGVAPLSAQQPASDAIPRELVLALIGGFGPARQPMDIVVGRVPASFPANTLPANATVLGGTERSAGVSVVLTVPESPDSAGAALVRHLERAGWRLADRGRREGFVAAPIDLPRALCRESASLALNVRERAQGGSLVLLSSAPDNTRCEESERRNPSRLDRPDLPALAAPAGARMLGSGMGGGREGREAFTRLESSMTSTDLAAHYARQLTRAGWTVTGPVVTEGLVVYGVRYRDEENRPGAGVLLVLDIPESQHRDVFLRLAKEHQMP